LSTVTESLRDEPGQTVDELVENTGVEEKLIMKFIREAKIASDAVVGTVPCGRCGKPAKSLAVRLCPKCLAQLQRASGAVSAKAQSTISAAADGSSHPGSAASPPLNKEDGDSVHETVKTKRK